MLKLSVVLFNTAHFWKLHNAICQKGVINYELRTTEPPAFAKQLLYLIETTYYETFMNQRIDTPE